MARIIGSSLSSEVMAIEDFPVMKTEKTEKKVSKKMNRQEREALIAELTTQMKEAAKLLEFEHAAFLRDQIKELQK